MTYSFDENKFREAGKLSRAFETVGSQLKTEQLKDVAAVYAQNMNRVVSLHSLSELLISFIGQQATDQESRVHPAYRSQVFTPPPVDTENPENQKRIEAELGAKRDEEAKKPQPTPEELIEEARGKRFERGIQFILQRAVADQDRFKSGMDPLFHAMIIGAWTAFEVLAEDLWKTAVDLCPVTLVRAMSKKDDTDTNRLKLSLDTEMFIASGFNLRGELGKFLATAHGLSFNKLERIKDAYVVAFKDQDITNVFDTNKDRSLFNISKVRNAMVHDAGRADSDFIKTMVDPKGAIPEFAALRGQNNPIIPIDGSITRGIVGGAILSTVNLVKAVDTWLAINMGK